MPNKEPPSWPGGDQRWLQRIRVGAAALRMVERRHHVKSVTASADTGEEGDDHVQRANHTYTFLRYVEVGTSNVCIPVNHCAADPLSAIWVMDFPPAGGSALALAFLCYGTAPPLGPRRQRTTLWNLHTLRLHRRASYRCLLLTRHCGLLSVRRRPTSSATSPPATFASVHVGRIDKKVPHVGPHLLPCASRMTSLSCT
jgi:hypothetical protein